MATMIIPLPPDGAGEFRAIKRELPKLLVRLLLFFTSFYGLFITLSVPWSLRAVIFDEIRYASMGPLAYVWGGMLLTFGTALMVRWCAVQALAFWEYDKRILNSTAVNHGQTPFVSIMVPAFNESDTIIPAIHSLVNLDYPSYEVIVIDDGSKDDTYAKALSLAGDYGHCTVRVITKPNAGKWSALNRAYHESKADYLLCVDADFAPQQRRSTHVGPKAERARSGRRRRPGDGQKSRSSAQPAPGSRIPPRQWRHAHGPQLPGAGDRRSRTDRALQTISAGGNPATTLQPARSREPWRGEGKVEGPLSGETFAEDFQLSLSCLALGHKVVYEPRAIAYTKCPHTVEGLLSQRYRWMRGTWQVLRIYARDLRPWNRELPSTRVPTLHHIMVTLYTVDVYLVPILNFFFWLALAGCAAMGLNLTGIAQWIGAVSLLNVMTALLYVLLQDDDPAILTMVPFLDIYQALLVNCAWVIAAIDELRRSRMSWS